MKNFIVVIPARLQSTRLPEKPLIEIEGKSIILRTYEQCLKAVDKELVYVATDSDKIYDHCKDHGMQVVMTPIGVLTGTDRVFEVSKTIKADYYVNVQGDEPVINPNDILKVIDAIEYKKKLIINGYTAISSEKEYKSTSNPKVVFTPNGRLMYMSRSGIPGNKQNVFNKAWRQVCIYAFPYDALQKFSRESKTPMEEEEDIEILRFLELGCEVEMIELSSQSIPVDQPEDVSKVEEYLKNANTTVDEK